MEILGTEIARPSHRHAKPGNASLLELFTRAMNGRLQKSAASREGATLIFISFEVCEYGTAILSGEGPGNR